MCRLRARCCSKCLKSRGSFTLHGNPKRQVFAPSFHRYGEEYTERPRPSPKVKLGGEPSWHVLDERAVSKCVHSLLTPCPSGLAKHEEAPARPAWPPAPAWFRPTHRLVVTQGGPELAQRHVAGSPAVVALDVLLVHLNGPRGVGQRVAVALGAQVGQAAVAIVDGVAGVQLDGLAVELDGVLVVLGCEDAGAGGGV